MSMKQYWIINAIIAVLFAVFAVMQEVWLSTPLHFWNSFGLSASFGIAGAACAEWAKILPKFINYWEWHWSDVIIGSVIGVFAALATALAVCG